MASKKFEKGSPEWGMFQDFWRLTQGFYIPEDDNGYWSDIVNAIDEFYKKHKNIPLSKHLALALVDMLEDVYKSQKGK